MASLWQQSQERAAKQMTSNDKQHKDCNFLCMTKFIKSCFMYSCDKHTDTSHAGFYQHHEPVNRVPKVGWASSILPAKLGSANSRSVGTSNCGWLPTGTYSNPPPDQGPPANTLLIREQDPGNHGSAGTSWQRGNCRGTTYNPEFCVPNIPSGKKGWGAETSSKPKGSQSVCEDRTLQDGRFSPAPRPFATTGLDGKDGFERCLPPDSYSPRLSTPTYLQMGETYKIQCLPFGLSATPRVFTKLLKPVVGFLRQIGCCLIIYLDDILIMHQERAHLEQIIQLTCQLFESLVNQKKSILTPTKELEFLGFQLCSMTMRLSVPTEKLRKIQQDAQSMLQQSSVSVREIAWFVEKATATLRVIPLAPLHYQALQVQMNSVLLLNHNQEEISDKYNIYSS